MAFTFQNQVPCGIKGLARKTGESCCKPSLPDDVEHPVKHGSTIQIAELSINGGVNREDVHVVARKDTMTALAPKMTITTTSTPAEKMQDPDSRYTVFNSYGHCLGRWYMSNTAQHMLEALMLPLNWIKKRLKISDEVGWIILQDLPARLVSLQNAKMPVQQSTYRGSRNGVLSLHLDLLENPWG